MREFLLDRIRLVRELIVGGPEVAYADLVLILTAVISGSAAARWPGCGIDRARFIELLVNHSPERFHCDHVCVAGLLHSKLIVESDTPWGVPGEATRIFTDDEIDLSFVHTQQKYPKLRTRDLKRHAFASLIYTWLRCSYAHEYALTEAASHMPPSRSNARISYIGRTSHDTEIKRITGFHLDYLIDLAHYHADNVATSEQTRPSKWWIEET